AVLRGEPDWTVVPADASSMTLLLKKCLEKDPRRRMRDMGDVRLVLDGAFAAPPDVAAVQPRPARRPAWVAAVGLPAVATGLTAAAAVVFRPRREPERVTRFLLTLPQGDRLLPAGAELTLSPSGDVLVYSAVRNGVQQLFERRFDQLQPAPIAGT